MITKFLSPEPDGGLPFEIEDLLQLQDGAYEALSYLAAAPQLPVILTGCTATVTTSGNCQVSSGYVFLEGEFRAFPGYQGPFPFYIVKDNPEFGTASFENGTIQNSKVTAKAKPVLSITSGQESIRMNPDNPAARFKAAITSQVTADLATEVINRRDADTGLQDEIDAINRILPTKAAKLYTAIPWTDIPLSPLTLNLESYTAFKRRRAQYMMDELGTVRLRGSIIYYPQGSDHPYGVILGYVAPNLVPTQQMYFNPYMEYQVKTFNDPNGSQGTYVNPITVFGSSYLYLIGQDNNSSIPTGAIGVYVTQPIWFA